MKKILSAVAFFMFLASTAHAIDAGTASGSLTIGKEKVKLTHCFAHDYRDQFGMGDPPELRILLADREVPQSLLAGYDGPMKLDALAREGKLRGVLIKLDSRKPTAGMSGTILMPPADSRASMLFFTSSGNEEMKDFRMGDNRVAGKAEYASEEKGAFKDIRPFKFSAAFSAPLFHDEPFAQKLAGPAAAKSPQARALLAYYSALFDGAFDKAQALATEERWSEVAAQRKKMGDVEFLGMMKQMLNVSELARSITKVFVRGPTAVILIKEKGSRSLQGMRQVDGTWRVDS
jgi:hypothetical protein